MKSLWKSNRPTSPPAIEMVSLHSPEENASSPPLEEEENANSHPEEEEEITNLLVVDHPQQSLFSSFNFSISKVTGFPKLYQLVQAMYVQ